MLYVYNNQMELYTNRAVVYTVIWWLSYGIAISVSVAVRVRLCVCLTYLFPFPVYHFLYCTVVTSQLRPILLSHTHTPTHMYISFMHIRRIIYLPHVSDNRSVEHLLKPPGQFGTHHLAYIYSSQSSHTEGWYWNVKPLACTNYSHNAFNIE